MGLFLKPPLTLLSLRGKKTKGPCGRRSRESRSRVSIVFEQNIPSFLQVRWGRGGAPRAIARPLSRAGDPHLLKHRSEGALDPAP